MIEVCHVEVRPNYHLLLRFNNGESRLFDMEPYLKYPVFKRLQNPVIFSLAQVDYGTVTWPGAIDIAPETLYGQSISFEKL